MYALSEPAPRLGRSFRLRILLLILILLALGTLSFGAAPSAAQRERLAQIRVPFVENCGQWDERVAFAAKTGFGAVFVTRDGELIYSLPGDLGGWTLTETFAAGNPAPQPLQPAITRVSYFRGSDPNRWQSGLSSYEEVGLGEVWPRISVALRTRGKTVEKFFTLQPGARAEKMRLRLDGAKSLRIDADGTLVASTGSGEIRFSAPQAYQVSRGVRRPITAAYVLRATHYGFRLGSYDRTLPVIVDPLLQSTYLGQTFWDEVDAITVHPSTGEVLVVGLGNSYPNLGVYQTLVARFDSALTTLLQATYLGDSVGSGIAVHPTSGEVLITGSTWSTDFPGTAGGAQPTLGGGHDGFVARLDPTLTTLIQSTYLGGSGADSGTAIAIHRTSGEVLVTGNTTSADFPAATGGAQPTLGGGQDGFVARLNPTLTTLIQSTYLGGSSDDSAAAIAIHPTTGEVLAAGSTTSTDFPATAGGAQSGSGGSGDGFVARLSLTLTILLQSTYLGGGNGEGLAAMTIDSTSGEVLAAGYTSSIDFPGVTGGAQAVPGGSGDVFIARLGAELTTLLQATYLGGGGGEGAHAIATDPSSGEVFVAGETGEIYLSEDSFPGVAGGAQPTSGGGFIARLNGTLTVLLQSTYLGGGSSSGEWVNGIAIHPASGELLAAGPTTAYYFPETAGGAQPAFGGFVDGFVARLTPDLTALLAPVGLTVDPLPNPGDGDFVFEPGETVPVIPRWKNLSDSPFTPTGTASQFPYTISNDTVSYGTIPPGSVGIAAGAYVMSIPIPDTRPATHWDASFTETMDIPHVLPYRHTLHIGDSFLDVPRSSLFYRYIENILHHGITAGCGSASYCPADPVSRAQIAVFLLKAEHGSAYVPPPCTGLFADVPCTPGTGFPDWIEQLFHEGITGGCGGGNYCPDSSVSRAQMSALLLKSEHGPSYMPPTCTGVFGDVVCPSLFADWIEQLAAEGITGGCGGGNYCPNNPNTRGQMAVFLVKTFGLQLYGP